MASVRFMNDYIYIFIRNKKNCSNTSQQQPTTVFGRISSLSHWSPASQTRSFHCILLNKFRFFFKSNNVKTNKHKVFSHFYSYIKFNYFNY